jgi:hypothetical protein
MRKLLVCGLLAAMVTACGGAQAPDSIALRQIAELEDRITALEAQLAVAEPADAPGEAAALSGFDLVVAQFVMDTAGFHDMDEALNESQTVDPAYLRSVTRVRKIVSQTTWPEELHEQAEALADVLARFATALEADDGAAAAELAAEVHTVQHDFSAAIDGWLGEDTGHGHGG